MTDKEKEVKEYLFNNVYTSIDDALIEFKKRNSDSKLKKEIEDYFGNDFLSQIKESSGFGVLSRYIISPNNELIYFLDLIEKIKLKPIFLEYGGKFVARNRDKYHLAKLFFHEGKDRNNQDIFYSKNIVNFNKYEGKKMCDIRDGKGNCIVDLHRKSLDKFSSGLKDNIISIDDWFDNNSVKYKNGYIPFLSLFLAHSVFFENYLYQDKEEQKFVMERLKPAIEFIERRFGIKPLIVPLLPIESEHDRYWLSYKADFKEYLVKDDL